MARVRAVPGRFHRGAPRGRRRAPGRIRAQLRTDLGQRTAHRRRAQHRRRARKRWEEVSTDIPGIGFRPSGSLTLATTDGERKVMEEFAAHPDAAARSITYVDPDEVAAVNPAVLGEVAGGLYCTDDATVEPRRALGALRDYLSGLTGSSKSGSYAFHPERRVHRVEDHALIDTAGTRWEADLIIVATGAGFDQLPGTAGGGRPGAPGASPDVGDRALSHAAHHGTGRRRHAALLPGLRGGAAGSFGRAVPGRRRPSSAAPPGAAGGRGVSPSATPTPTTSRSTSRWSKIRPSSCWAGPNACSVARCPRWPGAGRVSTPSAPTVRSWHVEELGPDVWLVTAPGGRGMTSAPAIAADTLVAAGVR